MDFQKDIIRGKRAINAVLRKKKKTKLITCWVSEDLRDEVYRKCPNVSEFIRTCLERLVASPIDKQIKSIYSGIAKETLSEIEMEDGRSADLGGTLDP